MSSKLVFFVRCPETVNTIEYILYSRFTDCVDGLVWGYGYKQGYLGLRQWLSFGYLHD